MLQIGGRHEFGSRLGNSDVWELGKHVSMEPHSARSRDILPSRHARPDALCCTPEGRLRGLPCQQSKGCQAG
jgi:hypothetical protein